MRPIEPLEPQDTAILMAMAADDAGKWDTRMTPRLSKRARPIALALRRGGAGHSEAAKRARAILDSVKSNRVERRAKRSA